MKKFCKMCNNITTHETEYGEELNRCLGCLLRKDQIEEAFTIDTRTYKEKYPRELNPTSGDPDN